MQETETAISLQSSPRAGLPEGWPSETAMSVQSSRRARPAGGLASALTALALLGCAPMWPGGPGLPQPANVGEAKIAATDYYNSGAYQRDIIA